MQRREEILAKKAKLAELKRQREEREQRQKELLKRESGTETPDVIKHAHSSELAKEARLILVQARAPTSTRSNDPKELERILEELLPDKTTSSGPTKPNSFSPSPRPSRPSSIVGDGRSGIESVERGLGSPHRSSSALTTSVSTQTISLGPIATNYEFVPVPVQLAPSYSRAIQTSEPWSPIRKNVSGDAFPDSDSDQFTPSRTPKASKRLSRRAREKEEELRQNLRREIEEELKAAQESVKEKPLSIQPPKVSTRTLTDGELDAVISSEEFLDFVDRSSKIVERALDEDYDVLVDYALRGQEGLDLNEDEGIREVTQFYDERWSKKRMISDLGFSPKVRFYFGQACILSLTEKPVSRASIGLIHQESFGSSRPIWSPSDMEHAPSVSPRIHFSQQLGHSHRKVFSVSPITYRWWILQRTSSALGHAFQIASPSTEDPTHRSLKRRSYAPNILNISGWNPECQQHNLLLHRWSRLRLDRRHAQPTTRIPRAHCSAPEQNRRYQSHLYVVPLGGSNFILGGHRRWYHLPMPSI